MLHFLKKILYYISHALRAWEINCWGKNQSAILSTGLELGK